MPVVALVVSVSANLSIVKNTSQLICVLQSITRSVGAAVAAVLPKKQLHKDMPPRDLDSHLGVWLSLSGMLDRYGDYGFWPPHTVYVSPDNGRPYFRPHKPYRQDTACEGESMDRR